MLPLFPQARDCRRRYVGIQLFDSEPRKIVRRLSRRDDVFDCDMFAIQLSPYHDGLTGAVFQISAAGVQRDGSISNDTFIDWSWDGVWESAVSINGEGWCAEMRIPFSQLRFPASEHHLWGINATRFIYRKNESVWLRLNAIFRWEWKPGSTLYLVWTEDRQNFADPGQFSPGRDIGKLFSSPSNDIFLVRLAYWFSR